MTLEEDTKEFKVVVFRESPRQLIWWPDSPKGTIAAEVRRTFKLGELTALPPYNPIDTAQSLPPEQPLILPSREKLSQLLLGE